MVSVRFQDAIIQPETIFADTGRDYEATRRSEQGEENTPAAGAGAGVPGFVPNERCAELGVWLILEQNRCSLIMDCDPGYTDEQIEQ